MAPGLSNDRTAGFSLIELILVLLILAILAVVAAPRWRGGALTLAAGAGRLMQDIRYARALAMSRGEAFTVLRIAEDGYEIQDADGGLFPAQPNPVWLNGLSIAPFSISFDEWGSPGAVDINVNISRGGEDATLRVVGVTGAVIGL